MKKQSEVDQLGHWKSVEGENIYKNSYLKAMELLPKPNSFFDIETSFGTVRVYEWSTDETKKRTPLLLLPGRSSGTRMWFKNLPDFIQKRSVYSLDALGDSGMSVQTAILKNSDDQANWINQTLEQLNLNKVHIVGHSFGGWTAANFASRYPDKLATMSLLEPVFTFQGVKLSLLLRITLSLLPFWPKKWKDDTLLTIGGTKKENVDPKDPIYRMIADGVAYFKPNLPQPDKITVEDIKKWNMPVYVAFADNSALHDSKKACKKAKKYVKKIKAKVWPNTTHSLPMEISSQIDSELINFWDGEEYNAKLIHLY
jgi:pimeloyl-ACP methyl ester carboxylesterase